MEAYLAEWESKREKHRSETNTLDHWAALPVFHRARDDKNVIKVRKIEEKPGISG